MTTDSPARRRKPGDGTVRKRGSTWYYQFSTTDPDTGKRKLVQKGGHPNERAARTAMRDHQADLRGGRAVLNDGRETLEGFLTRWQASVEASDLKASTKSFYGDMVRYALSPVAGLAKVQLNALEPATLAAAFQRLRERGGRDGRALSATTVHSTYRVLSQALREAVAEGLIVTSPIDRMTKRARPRKAKQSRAAGESHRWTTEEAGRFVRAAIADDSPDGLALAFMVRLGLRRGEALGLRWRDIEDTPAGPVIRVRQNRVVVDGIVHVTSTKTDDSERSIPADSIGDLIDLARSRQAAHRLRAGVAWTGADALDPEGLLFRREDGTDVHPQSIRHPLRRITRAAGIERELSPHKLRHTAASVMVETGLDVITVASILGHSDASMVLRLYAHADQRHVAAELRRVAAAHYG